MLILRVGLYLAILLALYTTWASDRAGYPIEVAAVRGLLVFMAGGFVAYLAELVVMTAPPREQQQESVAERPQPVADDETDESTALTVVRGGRDMAAADERRAA